MLSSMMLTRLSYKFLAKSPMLLVVRLLELLLFLGLSLVPLPPEHVLVKTYQAKNLGR